MDAWELRDAFGLDQMRLVQRPDPEPGAGEVVLAMRAASLNYRDLVAVKGGYGSRFRLPRIPVSDGVGEVVAAGAGVRRVRPGDRVCPAFFPEWTAGPPSSEKFRLSLGGDVDGVLSRLVVAPETAVVRVPDHLDDVEAACLPCAGVTAWSAVIGQGRIGPGETLLVQGTGGVALFALQFAKAAGARVIVTSSDDAKLERARALGADETINYRTTPDWDRVAKDLTSGEGCDHVLELGGAGTLERSIRAARTGGTLSLIGVLAGAKAEVALPLVVMRNLRLQGVTVGSREDFEAMARAIALHRLRPVVDRVFGFAAAPEAFAYLAEQRHVGKVAIRY